MPHPRSGLAIALALAALALSACSPDQAESGEAEAIAGANTAPNPSESTLEEAKGTVVAHAVGAELTAYSRADDASEPVATMANPIPSGGALVLSVLTPPSGAEDDWLEVMLPLRPNGTTGWIPTDEVELSINPYSLAIDTSDYRLDVSKDGEVVLSTPIAVGTGDTPTPYGDFYLAELLQPPDPDGVYGPFAFGLSGFSDVLDSFAGGEGVIGIHGTNEPEALGTDVSHGCIRVDNDVIGEMALTVPLGAPVSIRH